MMFMKKIDYDLHIHTEYCGHAKGMKVQDICRQADEKQLRLIAITDHTYSIDEQAALDKIRRQVQQSKPNCRVLVGAEVDVDGVYSDGRLVVDDLTDLDLVIAGFHYVPTKGHYPRQPEDRGMAEEQFLEVWESSLYGIVSNSNIDILAHPARLLATSVDLGSHFEYALSVFEKAAGLSAENHIAWELNELSFYRIPPSYKDQWYRIFQIALDAGVKLVFGSDAHTPAAVGVSNNVQEVLKQLPQGCLSMPEDILGDRI